MAAPSVLISSCTEDFHPDELVKQILSVDPLSPSQNVVEKIQAYSWDVNTKYYTADVRLCTTSERTIGDEAFADSVEAFICYFDSEKESSFEQVKSWLPFVKEINPEVRMIVCQKCDTTSAVSRLVAQEWCVDNLFELVELCPEQDSDDQDQEDDFIDSFGIKRIIQSLQAHTWPNLVLKDRPSIRSPYFQQLMKEQAEENAANQEKADSASTHSETAGTESSAQNDTESQTQNSNIPKPCTDNLLAGMLPEANLAILDALGTEEQDDESFDKLFQNLRIMKDKADTLPSTERRAYAEKVAVSFWRAIGGDENEIATLTDSDND